MSSDDNESHLSRYKARLTDQISDSEVSFQNIYLENHNRKFRLSNYF